MSEALAPCIAVVGPANAGKTTLLHQLDEIIAARQDHFLIVKGNPDGTGRYLYYAPDLREAYKSRVKGYWGSTTVDRICEWITEGRNSLGLVLLDFGGRHDESTAPGNRRMLSACSHYLVVNRNGQDDDAEIWHGVCRELGLLEVARMRSLIFDGDAPAIWSAPGGVPFEGAFQVGVKPGDERNSPVLAPLADRLIALSRPLTQTPYINLRRDWWGLEMIADVGGEAARISLLANRTGVVVLGGRAPAWAYLSALRTAILQNPGVKAYFFDPKHPKKLIEIPKAPTPAGAEPAFDKKMLSADWRVEGDTAILHVTKETEDRFLPPIVAENLEHAAWPGDPPSRVVAITGDLPMWLFGAYVRWMIHAGAEKVLVRAPQMDTDFAAGCFADAQKIVGIGSPPETYVQIWP